MEKTIGERILELREAYQLDRRTFANHCGLSYLAICNIENGKTNRPHRITLQNIAEVFGASTDWIIDGRGNMLLNGPREIKALNSMENSYNIEDPALIPLKIKNQYLEKELEMLWQLLERCMNKRDSTPKADEPEPEEPQLKQAI